MLPKEAEKLGTYLQKIGFDDGQVYFQAAQILEDES
jgi:hypothetical protein